LPYCDKKLRSQSKTNRAICWHFCHHFCVNICQWWSRRVYFI